MVELADGSAQRQPSAPSGMGRVAMASYIGSAIEHYDFVIYGTAAALVFPEVFFPHMSTTMASVASLGTFASAFVSRPIGAAVFGYFGDRIGRKKILLFTLMIMGISTVGVGLIPAASVIGAGAPLLLVALRLCQGFAVGGEWAGSALLCAEYAPPGRRGLYGMFTQLGFGTALVLANLAFLVVHEFMGNKSEPFLQWGWRIPFLLSAVLIAVGLYIRLRIEETPEFARASAEQPDAAPIADLLRRQGRQVVLVVGALIGVQALLYQLGTFFIRYASAHLGYSRSLILLVGVLGGLCTIVAAAASAICSDRFGRRPLVGLGLAMAVPWSFAVFPLIETRDPVMFGVAMLVSYGIVGVAIGPLAAFLPEIFATHYRYTGCAISHNLGGILGGALPPVVSPVLLATHGSISIGLMMAALALLSLISVGLLGETAGPRARVAAG